MRSFLSRGRALREDETLVWGSSFRTEMGTRVTLDWFRLVVFMSGVVAGDLTAHANLWQTLLIMLPFSVVASCAQSLYQRHVKRNA